MKIINLINLSKSYRNPVINNISYSFIKGKTYLLVGENGSGKTTLIKLIMGFISPTSGKIEKLTKSISYVPDNPEIYDRLNGIEYLNFIADMYGISKEDRTKKIDYYTKLFNIQDSLGDIISSFSHGMKQKLVLTSALLNDPNLFILDEPMVGLDPKSAHLLKEQMRKHCDNGNTVFFSTHVLEVAEKLCDRIGIIHKGKLIAIGTMDELRQDDKAHSLENIFLELTEQ